MLANYPNTMTPPMFSSNYGDWPIPEPPSEFVDDRFNPIAWRTWFREFLLAKIPAAIETLLLPEGLQAMIARRCRSSPFAEKAWKMKAWKQKF